MTIPWYKEAIFYHIYPLGFCGAEEHRLPIKHPSQSRLQQLENWIPHFQDLGINALYLGPLFESESHGYDTVNYLELDRRLGQNTDLIALISQLHQKGIRVVLDAVFNHVGRSFFAFQDLLKHGQNSRYTDWFHGLDFSKSSPMGDPFSYTGWDGHYNLVKLNLKNPELSTYLLQVVSYWIKTFNIDGLRLDAADVMDKDFLRQLAQYAQKEKEDFWLMGEVVHGDYRHWASSDRLHATTNYECYKGLYSSHNDGNYFEIAHSLERLFSEDKGLYKDLYLYNFADNHDVNRVASRLKEEAHLYPLYLLLFSMPGIPSLYYGSEWGIKAQKSKRSDSPLRPQASSLVPQQNASLEQHLTQLIALRKQLKSLQHGNYTPVHVSSKQLAFTREYQGEKTLVCINSGEKTQIDLSHLPHTNWKMQLGDPKELKHDSSSFKLTLPAQGGLILTRAA